MSRITYYHILGVSSDATDDEIAAAFRRKVKQWHPDVCRHPDAEERMREINEAAGVLCDPERRARYDRALAGKGSFEPPGAAPHPDDAGAGIFSRFRPFRRPAKAAAPFRVKRETVRFAATGCAALFVLCILAALLLMALPLSGGSPVVPAATGSADLPAGTLTGAQDAVLLQDEGDRLLASGDYGGALLAYDEIIAQNPAVTDRDFWYNRGTAQNALGLYSEAAESFDAALRDSPEDTFALAQKGAALLGLGNYEESLRYTDRALDRGSDAGWIWNNRGIALAGIGQDKEARAAFENAAVLSGQPASELYRNVVLKASSSPGF